MSEIITSYYRGTLNHLKINGLTSPGLVIVTGVKLSYNWEAHKGDNTSGATKRYKGRDLAKATLTFRLFNERDRELWEEFVVDIKYPDAGTRKLQGYDVDHPQLTAYGISSWTISEITLPERGNDNVWQAVIELEEYRERKLAVARVSGSKASKGSASGDSPLEKALKAKRDKFAEAQQEKERKEAQTRAAEAML